MKIQAPFQGQYEPAGQGFDGRRFYDSIRFVLRAYNPRKYRQWQWKFVWSGPVERRYRTLSPPPVVTA